MDIKKILNKSTTDYQVSMARLVLSYSRADEATQKQLLESYIAIIKDYEDGEWRKEIRSEEDAEIRMAIMDEDGRDIDEIMDDPRHGQADPINRGDF
jgi:hypothetical protein